MRVFASPGRLTTDVPIFCATPLRELCSLPIPTREEIENSPTGNGGAMLDQRRAASPVAEDPSAELEKELASTHLGARR